MNRKARDACWNCRAAGATAYGCGRTYGRASGWFGPGPALRWWAMDPPSRRSCGSMPSWVSTRSSCLVTRMSRRPITSPNMCSRISPSRDPTNRADAAKWWRTERYRFRTERRAPDVTESPALRVFAVAAASGSALLMAGGGRSGVAFEPCFADAWIGAARGLPAGGFR